MSTCEKSHQWKIASAYDNKWMQGVYWHAGKGMSSIDQAFNVQVRLPSLSN